MLRQEKHRGGGGSPAGTYFSGTYFFCSGSIVDWGNSASNWA
jgi:hypothetical protein